MYPMCTSRVVPAAAALMVVLCGWFGGVTNAEASVTVPDSRLTKHLGDVSPDTVRKTVFSDKMRMIFVAGLEGSGHHFMDVGLHRMCQHMEITACHNVCDIGDALYNEVGRFQDAYQYQTGLKRLRSEMDALVLTAKGSRSNGSVPSVAMFLWCPEVGEMSFPNFGGRDRSLQYVDVRILAEEAERAGVDLRVIYMSRPSKKILISTTEHRRFGSLAHQARVLINAASVLGSSLRELDPDFITCFAYDDVASLAQASRVAKFVMPSDESAILFSQTLLEIAKDRHEESDVADNHTDKWKLVSNRLQQKIDEIDREQC